MIAQKITGHMTEDVCPLEKMFEHKNMQNSNYKNVNLLKLDFTF